MAGLPSVRQNPNLFWSFCGAAGALFAWAAALVTRAFRSGRTFALEIVLRKQHYLQACAQGSVLLYWGWYWREVYDSAPLIVAQLVFAYAFDMLLVVVAARHLHARVRTLPGHLQHQPVPLVQAGLVLPAVPDGGGRLRRQGADPMEQGRAAARTSSTPRRFRWRSFSLASDPDAATHDMTWGPEIADTQFHAAAHLPDDLPRRPAGTVPVRRHDDDACRPS